MSPDMNNNNIVVDEPRAEEVQRTYAIKFGVGIIIICYDFCIYH